jgi:hypothetical protein
MRNNPRHSDFLDPLDWIFQFADSGGSDLHHSQAGCSLRSHCTGVSSRVACQESPRNKHANSSICPLLKQPMGCLGHFDADDIASSRIMQSLQYASKGTASLADREVPAKRRTFALSENNLQFHADRGSDEIAGQFGCVGAIILVSY